jgi:hypothetical protein
MDFEMANAKSSHEYLPSPRSRILRTVGGMTTAQQEVLASQLDYSGLVPLLHME